MWTILKFNKKDINLLFDDLKKKIGKDVIIYKPKIIVESFRKNKLVKKEIYLLGDYLLCYHEKFNQLDLRCFAFLRGLKYFLNGSGVAQKEIKAFVDMCKNSENNKGFITTNFFELIKNQEYKFKTGPFAQKIFKIVNFQKNKIDIILGNIKTSINKKKFLFNPI